ncbi:MAG: VOC family protein [Alphaproteobacteria bacterium]
MTGPALRTSHLTLRVADLPRSIRFYRDVFGFAELGTDVDGRILLGIDGTAMLALEPAHDAGAPRPRVEPEPFIGMEHFAFEIAPDDFETLRAFYRRLKTVGAEIHHTVDHIVTNSIYFLDPDRNLIEAYVNCPRERFQAMEHPYGSLESLDDALEGKCLPTWMREHAAVK